MGDRFFDIGSFGVGGIARSVECSGGILIPTVGAHIGSVLHILICLRQDIDRIFIFIRRIDVGFDIESTCLSLGSQVFAFISSLLGTLCVDERVICLRFLECCCRGDDIVLRVLHPEVLSGLVPVFCHRVVHRDSVVLCIPIFLDVGPKHVYLRSRSGVVEHRSSELVGFDRLGEIRSFCVRCGIRISVQPSVVLGGGLCRGVDIHRCKACIVGRLFYSLGAERHTFFDDSIPRSNELRELIFERIGFNTVVLSRRLNKIFILGRNSLVFVARGFELSTESSAKLVASLLSVVACWNRFWSSYFSTDGWLTGDAAGVVGCPPCVVADGVSVPFGT